MPAAYNPYDPLQSKFLGALAYGEVGGSKNSTYLGTGGADLSQAAHDAYGFPQWDGFGNSHAAGTYQFQPKTWDGVAAAHNLNFQNPEDQNAAAWYLAQDTYKAKTGKELGDALSSGDYSSIQSALKDVWPSVLGNATVPGGIVNALTGGKSAAISNGKNPTSADTSGGSGGLGGMASAVSDLFNPFKSSGAFTRWGLLIVGVVILLIALWHLLSQADVVPSPAEVGHGIASAATVAALA
jgi:hypothetical protein